MITEDFVSFEIAKLLNDKGFRNAETLMFYNSEGKCFSNQFYYNFDKNDIIDCPTLQMTMKWLRDVHNLIISVKFTIHGWLCDITKIFRDSNGFIVNINHGIGDDALSYCDEYEKSCEAAIKYCLENLI